MAHNEAQLTTNEACSINEALLALETIKDEFCISYWSTRVNEAFDKLEKFINQH